jgi:hypothetical protein
MRHDFRTTVLAVMLVFCAVVLVAQEQQSPPSQQPQPQASSPSQAGPEKTEPQTAEPQTTAPNPATPEAPAAKDQTPQEPPPGSLQTPVAPNEQGPAAQSKSASKGSGVRKKKGAKPSAAQAHHATRPHKTVTNPSGKVVVRNGGAKDNSIQLSPAGNQQQNSHDRENTDQLLARADDNLKQVAGLQLTTTQQSTADQIRMYMRQAKSAAGAGDLARAHTLALKAHLLSVDLTKR